MDLYKSVAHEVSQLVTERYSTSFSMSTQLFDASIRPDIYAVYGLVRIADEIVDTYRGQDAKELLAKLEDEVYKAIERGYDTNPIVHSFALTAKQYAIDATLIRPFFESMAMDLHPVEYTQQAYETYIHGSAEVIGLMCLRVFCQGNDAQYQELEAGARSLGSAYQKVNFLRDIAADYNDLGRLYFPGITYDTFTEEDKMMVVHDIETDIAHARKYVDQLPTNSRRAVALSLKYYGDLLDKIKRTPADVLKKQRIRVSPLRKIIFYASIKLGLVK